MTAAQALAADRQGACEALLGPALGLGAAAPGRATPRAARGSPGPALAALEGQSWRLGCLVRASSRRGDVREKRAKILLVLLAMRPPPGAKVWKAWYVPGAVARLGHEGLQRVWRRYLGEDPPCDRTVRQHLADLEAMHAIVRAPGDYHPGRATREGRRIRWPDTFHVLDSEAEAHWWATVGHRRAQATPRAAWDPRTWRRLFARWRAEARQGELFDGAASASAVTDEEHEERAARATPTRAELARPPDLPARLRAASRAEAAEVLCVLRDVGEPVRGRNEWALAAASARTRAAAALLARALERGDRVRSLAAWITSAARRAGGAELAHAAPWVAHELPGGTSPLGPDDTTQGGLAWHGRPPRSGK